MLLDVKIKNFLSIKSEQIIKINDKNTSIIGKNDVGKTNILKAIRMLGKEKIPFEMKNIEMSNEESSIVGRMIFKKEEVKIMNSKSHYSWICELPSGIDLYFSINISSDFDKTYELNVKEGKNDFASYDIEEFEKKIKINIKKYINSLKPEKEISIELTQAFNDIINKNIDENDRFSLIKYYEEQITDDFFEEKSLADIREKLNKAKAFSWIELFPKYKFVYLNSFTDLFLSDLSIEELKKSESLKILLKMGGISIEELEQAISEQNNNKLYRILNTFSLKVTDKIKKINSQVDEEFELKLFSSSGRTQFFTHDKTDSINGIPLSEKSDGFRWFLSLYLLLYDYLENDEKNTILLIDEPSLYLHATAQQDLLKKLFCEEFNDMQIIYTTHSPYLIDADVPFSIKIVDKNKETLIFNNPSDYAESKGDQRVDAITPLLGALELSFSNSLVFTKEEKLLVVEGLQDVYILTAFIKKLKYETKFKTIKFIPSYNADKTTYVFGYLYGMGYKPYILVDFDNPGKKSIKEISENDSNNELYNRALSYNIIHPQKTDKFLLENLFTVQDKNKYLPDKLTPTYKDFQTKVLELKFEEATLKNFKELLDKILEVLS